MISNRDQGQHLKRSYIFFFISHLPLKLDHIAILLRFRPQLDQYFETEYIVSYSFLCRRDRELQGLLSSSLRGVELTDSAKRAQQIFEVPNPDV